jgi:hypothetical protein
LPQRLRIGFSIDAYWLTAGQEEFLRDEVFAELPEGGSELPEWLQNDISLLVVTDTGCRGLGGPTRADITLEGSSDFVDFVRNVGRDAGKALGGGTYGFGKGVLYEASASHTILVYTRTTSRSGLESRFIAINLGNTYDIEGKRYTGRHWWGVGDPITGAEPARGLAADRIAQALGMSRLLPDETGTAIAVVHPVVDEGQASLTDIVQATADAAGLWAWPHMAAADNEPGIDFAFTAEDEPVVGQDPVSHPLLRYYVEAYTRASSALRTGTYSKGWPWTVKEVRSERPDRRLGVLAYRRIQTESNNSPPTSGARVDSHVALMRRPRLVVKYQEVQRDAHGHATAGVFVADDALDRDFALSEPVAHDDWVPSNLQLRKYERNPVKQALERLKKEFRAESRRQLEPETDTSFIGVARLATAMGDLLQGHLTGTDARIHALEGFANKAASKTRPSHTGSGKHRQERTPRTGPGVRLIGEPRLSLKDGDPVATFGISVSIHGTDSLRVTAVPRVVLDGGVPEPIGDHPLGAASPVVIGWEDATGNRIADGPEIDVRGNGDHEFRILVRQPEDAAVTLQVHAKELS